MQLHVGDCMLDRKCQTVHSVIIYIITSNISVVTALVSGARAKDASSRLTMMYCLPFLLRFSQCALPTTAKGLISGQLAWLEFFRKPVMGPSPGMVTTVAWLDFHD